MAEKKLNSEPRFRSTYGDLAYDLDYAERKYRLEHAGEEPKEPEKETYIRPAKKQQTQANPTAKPKVRVMPRMSPAMALSCVAVAAVLLMTVLGYIALDRISRDIVSLKASVSELKQENINLTTKHELTFDLSSVKAAAEAAGMSKPSSSQVYYLDLASEDQVAVYAPKGSLLSTVQASVHSLISNAREYFR